MKNLFFVTAAVATLLAGAASAATVGVRVIGASPDGTIRPNSYAVEVTGAQDVNVLGQNVTVDAVGRDDHAVGGTDTQRLEGGVTVRPLAHMYVRGAVGYRFGPNDWAYYSVEPGVEANITKRINASVGVRYRNTFANVDRNQFESVALRTGVSYSVTNTTAVRLGVDRLWGDTRQTQVSIGVSHTF